MTSSSQILGKNLVRKFASYEEALNVSPRVRKVCEILARVYPGEVETALGALGVKLEPEDVDEVLRLSYACPDTAVVFFRWAGLRFKYSGVTWNLMVDLLGKNKMFEKMWDAVRSMRQERLLGLETFVSVFKSYCEDGKVGEAIMSFDVMGKYGVEADVVAVNALLSAMCRGNVELGKVCEFFERVKGKVTLDGESYRILLEACEKEGNVAKARTLFGEMVISVGWDPRNVAAYDAFLVTLVRGAQVNEAIKFVNVMEGKNCFPGAKFFFNAIDILVEKNDSGNALLIWDMMVKSGLVPSAIMYNAMIGLHCKNDRIAKAFQLLDEMPLNGIFANSLTYNVIFQCLIKNKKVKEASKFFVEMTKNEQPPTPENCAAAISMFFDLYDPEMAFEVWSYMNKNGVSPLDDSANAILSGLASMGRFTELRRTAEKNMKGRINIYKSTMEKVKIACHREGKNEVYDELDRKWRSS